MIKAGQIISKAICAGILISVSATAQSALIRVSQESATGAGDFDANVLGTISTFDTALTSAAFYQYGSPNGASYNGENNGGPAPVSDTTINFFAITSDGLTFYNVHDRPNDGSGGDADMTWSLTGGDTAAFMVGDDSSEGLSPGLNVQATSFTSRHRWLDCCTDGFGLGTIDGGGWELFGEFDSSSPYDGGELLAWSALSADGGVIPLAFELDRQVRFDLASPIPVPAAFWLFGTALLGFVGFSRRRKIA